MSKSISQRVSTIEEWSRELPKWKGKAPHRPQINRGTDSNAIWDYEVDTIDEEDYIEDDEDYSEGDEEDNYEDETYAEDDDIIEDRVHIPYINLPVSDTSKPDPSAFSDKSVGSFLQTYKESFQVDFYNMVNTEELVTNLPHPALLTIGMGRIKNRGKISLQLYETYLNKVVTLVPKKATQYFFQQITKKGEYHAIAWFLFTLSYTLHVPDPTMPTVRNFILPSNVTMEFFSWHHIDRLYFNQGHKMSIIELVQEYFESTTHCGTRDMVQLWFLLEYTVEFYSHPKNSTSNIDEEDKKKLNWIQAIDLPTLTPLSKSTPENVDNHPNSPSNLDNVDSVRLYGRKNRLVPMLKMAVRHCLNTKAPEGFSRFQTIFARSGIANCNTSYTTMAKNLLCHLNHFSLVNSIHWYMNRGNKYESDERPWNLMVAAGIFTWNHDGNDMDSLQAIADQQTRAEVPLPIGPDDIDDISESGVVSENSIYFDLRADAELWMGHFHAKVPLHLKQLEATVSYGKLQSDITATLGKISKWNSRTSTAVRRESEVSYMIMLLVMYTNSSLKSFSTFKECCKKILCHTYPSDLVLGRTKDWLKVIHGKTEEIVGPLYTTLRTEQLWTDPTTIRLAMRATFIYWEFRNYKVKNYGVWTELYEELDKDTKYAQSIWSESLVPYCTETYWSIIDDTSHDTIDPNSTRSQQDKQKKQHLANRTIDANQHLEKYATTFAIAVWELICYGDGPFPAIFNQFAYFKELKSDEWSDDENSPLLSVIADIAYSQIDNVFWQRLVAETVQKYPTLVQEGNVDDLTRRMTWDRLFELHIRETIHSLAEDEYVMQLKQCLAWGHSKDLVHDEGDEDDVTETVPIEDGHFTGLDDDESIPQPPSPDVEDIDDDFNYFQKIFKNAWGIEVVRKHIKAHELKLYRDMKSYLKAKDMEHLWDSFIPGQ